MQPAIDIPALTAQMKAMDQVHCPSTHAFQDGYYCRQTIIPAGTLVVGRRHRKPSINMLLSGRVVLIVDGRTVALEAPESFVSDAGEQKIAYAVTDILAANIFETSCLTVEDVEREVFES